VINRARAEQHKPASLAELAPEIHRLTADGLKPRDVAAALAINVLLVLHVLGPPSEPRERT